MNTETVERVGLVTCVALITFLLGQAVAYFQLPTSQFVGNAFSAFEAVKAGWEDFGVDDEVQARASVSEAVIHDSSLMGEGYTLVIETGERSLFTAAINLVAPDGEVKHSWTVPWEDIEAVGWPDTAGGGVPMSRQIVYPRSVHMYPNGDLLLIMHARGRTPFGVGMAKLDADSNLVWFNNRWAHHDSSVGDDGNIYTLGHELRLETTPTIEMMKSLNYDIHVDAPYIDDTILILSAEGEELLELSLTEALGSSEFVPVFAIAPPDEQGDHLHANSIQVVTNELADQIPFANAGDVLISVRTLHALLLVDMETQKVSWVGTGSWRYQHDANFLANGNILFFDNIGGTTHTGGGSRALELNPVTGEIVWQYEGTEEMPMLTRELGEIQKVDNGNVLITETLSGRVLEVTPDKEVVWEYFSQELIDAERIPFDRMPARFQ